MSLANPFESEPLDNRWVVPDYVVAEVFILQRRRYEEAMTELDNQLNRIFALEPGNARAYHSYDTLTSRRWLYLHQVRYAGLPVTEVIINEHCLDRGEGQRIILSHLAVCFDPAGLARRQVTLAAPPGSRLQYPCDAPPRLSERALNDDGETMLQITRSSQYRRPLLEVVAKSGTRPSDYDALCSQTNHIEDLLPALRELDAATRSDAWRP